MSDKSMQKKINKLNERIDQLELLAKVNKIQINGLRDAFFAGFTSIEANECGVSMEDCWDQYSEYKLGGSE